MGIEKHWLEKISKNVDELKNLPQELKNEDFYVELIKQASYLFNKLPKTHSLCVRAVKIEGLLLQDCPKITEKLCFEAVKNNGMAIQHVPKYFMSKALSLVAVKSSPYALQFIEDQDDEICLKAVTKDGFALSHVKKQTPEICLKALTNTETALEFIKICPNTKLNKTIEKLEQMIRVEANQRIVKSTIESISE